ATCRNAAGLDEAYAVTVGAEAQTVTRLAPGRWVHTLTVDATGQEQHQPSVVLTNAGGNGVRFTAAASVATVSTTNDGGAGPWREGVGFANTAPRPALIQFDEHTFPPGTATAINLASALPAISGAGITLDGIDATGAAGNRVIDAGGQTFAGL